MAEQFGLEQVFRNRAAVDAHQLLVFPGAVEVDGFRDQFFSGTGLTLDQYRAVQAGDRVNQLENPIHRAAAADDVVETVLFVELFLEVLVFETQLAFSKSLAHHDGQFDQLEGLR